MGVEVNLHHHNATHKKKAWHLKEILSHAIIHSIWYRTCHLTRIKTQDCHIFLPYSHLTHKKMSIINKDDMQKMTKRSSRLKRVLESQSKSAWNLKVNIPTFAYKSKVVSFKLDSYLPQRQIYLLYLIKSRKIVLSKLLETYMLLMDYSSIIGEALQDYTKKVT